MEGFLKPFLENGVVYSLENVQVNTDDNVEFNYSRLLQKIIFKHDVVIEFKKALNSACVPEPITVNNDIINKLIANLNLLLSTKNDIKEKIDVFVYIFKTFAATCKADENEHVMQFFVILSHLLGINNVPPANKNSAAEDCSSIIDIDNFNSTFEVEISNPSSVTFSIFKELLVCLSKLPVNFNSTEVQSYSKWLQSKIRNIAYFQPFRCIYLEIFSVCADIDVKLLEGNVEHFFCTVLGQRPPVEKEFCQLYSAFFEKALDICSKYQRTPKLIMKFISSIKATPVLLDKDIILPSNVTAEFCKIVAAASNQQSISIFDVLVQNIDECFSNHTKNNLGSNTLQFLILSDFMICFLKEVKLFAPSIAATTLKSLLDKLNNLKSILQKFATYLFSDTSRIAKNENIVKSFLELCIYCGEIEVLIDCYKDSVLQPSDAETATTEYDWHCCLLYEQWKTLVNIVLKSKLDGLSRVCLHLALQKCRHYKLQNKVSQIDDTTLKIIASQLTAGLKKLNVFQFLSPEDFTILTEVLTPKQCKSITKKILKQLLENNGNAESTAWLCSPILQENSIFVINLFSLIMKETGTILQELIPDNIHSNISWLLNDYYDDRYNIPSESMEGLPEKMSLLLKTGKKIRKHIGKNSEQKDLLVKLLEVFKSLPLPYLRGDSSRLGLCFSVKMGVLLSDDETGVRSAFESICNFLSADVDASTCFDLGLCVKWVSEICYEEKKVEERRMKVIEILVRNSPNTKFGLNQMGEMIDSTESSKHTNQLKMLENRVVLYNELGKCWQRAKKRKSDNDLIGSCRVKLAKIISEEARKLDDSINSDNSKLLLKIFAIELNKAIKTNDENEISVLMEEKFPSYFDFAVNALKENVDEASISFLMIVLNSMSHVRKFLPEDSFLKIWRALKFCEKVNWRLFSTHSTEEEFKEILDDLLKVSEKFLHSDCEKHSSNCFDIWVAFFEASSDSKKDYCQLRLQEFFRYIHNCGLFLKDLTIKKKIFLMKFSTFCVSKREVILTSHMLDTIIHAMLECLDDCSSVEDFGTLFTAEVETASAILLRQFDWSRSKIHLTFVLFKRLLASLMKRCEVNNQDEKDAVIKLSTCAYSLEKWASLLIKRERDFARTTPYFITALISSIASITVLPPIKIHLVNCINYFLSISDSHTVSYLMRILKPGYQQVFNSMYNQFKKYHKYSGKI